jgi:hypothetical protein
VAWGATWPDPIHSPRCTSIRFEPIGTWQRARQIKPGASVCASCPIGSEPNMAWCCAPQPGCSRISANKTPKRPSQGLWAWHSYNCISLCVSVALRKALSNSPHSCIAFESLDSVPMSLTAPQYFGSQFPHRTASNGLMRFNVAGQGRGVSAAKTGNCPALA